MFTTRGYRQAKRENKNKSRQGQIIQKKPFFTIDNNPYVLEQYRKFLMGNKSTPTPTPPQPTFNTDDYNITLSEYSLSWSSSDRLPAIIQSLITFAQNVFNQYTTDGKYPLSLELYAPTLNNYIEWIQADSSSKIEAYFKRIYIDINGNIYWYQQNGGPYEYNLHGSTGSLTMPDLRLGYATNTVPAYSNPPTMKMSVNYFTL